LRPHNNENANAAATQHPTSSLLLADSLKNLPQSNGKISPKTTHPQSPFKTLRQSNTKISTKKQQDTQSAFEKHSLTIKGQNLSKKSKQHAHKVHSKLSNNQKQISTTTASADYLQINQTQRKEKEGKKKERRRS
jgi:hypothetical protein